jgi:hypothetical protein
MPMLNGLGARPWQLKRRDLVERWYALQLARIESGRNRALEAIDENEALPDPHVPYLEQVKVSLFDGVGRGRPRADKACYRCEPVRRRS